MVNEEETSVENGATTERIARFVIENFPLQRCKRYVKVDLATVDEFTDKSSLKPTDCACGHALEWHTKHQINVNLADRETRWSLEDDTSTRACDSFGRLYFVPGDGIDSSSILPGASASYIRLAGRSNRPTYMEDVYKLMTAKHLWGLPVPQLIIEVAGTKPKKSTYVDKDVLDRFNEGIINAAKAANAWIVTGGTNRGVMKLVGDAVARSRSTSVEAHSITCIGVVPWGVVNHREQLVNFEQKSLVSNGNSSLANGTRFLEVRPAPADSTGHNPLVRNKSANPNRLPPDVIMDNWTSYYTVERPDNCKDGVPLNPGHNCFIFIDNAREKRFSEEVAFRNQFLHYLSQKTLNGTGDTAVTKTPVVLLVVGGGVNTLALIEQSVTTKTSVELEQEKADPSGNVKFSRPVVLLSGLFMGASDLLSFAYSISAPSSEKRDQPFSDEKFSIKSKFEQSHFGSDFEERIRQHPAFEELLALVAENKRKDEEVKAITAVKNCLKYRSMITVVNLLEDNSRLSLDSAILDAIFKSNFGSPATTFELAQLWDRGDIAKQILRQHDEAVGQGVDIRRALTRAMLFGQTDFVKLFIDDGHFDLTSFLTIGEVKNIYAEMFIQCRGKAGKSSSVRLFRSLLMRRTREDELSRISNRELLRDMGDIFANLLGCHMSNIYSKEEHFKQLKLFSNSTSADVFEQPYQTSIRDMFLLQLLLYRKRMAVYFFQAGHDHIGSALMAAIFLRSLSKQAERLDMTDLANAYEEQSMEWQNRAIELLSSCYEQDPVTCGRLLRRSLLTWQELSFLEMAYYGDRKEIMEQPAVQTALSQIWLGQMATFTRSSLIYMTLLPPLLPFLIFKIRFEERNSRQHTQGELHLPKWRNRSGKVADIHVAKAELQSKGSLRPHQKSVRAVNPVASETAKQYHDVKLTKPSLFNPSKPGRMSVLRAIYLLYSSPIAKYMTHSVTLCLFLLLFLFFILGGVQEGEIREVEFIVWFCCFVYSLDIFRQGFGQKNLSFVEKLQDFLQSTWTIADLFGLCLILIAIALRFSLADPDYVYAHTVYVAACVVYWIKTLRMFFVTEVLGPKVFTLFNMMKDLIFFILIYVILLLAFSTPIYCLMYPDQNIDNMGVYFALLFEISYDRIWNLFQVTTESSRSQVEGSCRNLKNSTDQTLLVQVKQNFQFEDPLYATNATKDSISATRNNETIETSFAIYSLKAVTSALTCSQRNVLAIGLYIVYLLLTNVCLLNMLIAMFFHTVDNTRSSATRLWRFSIYSFLQEYYFRPILPGPFMIFELAYRFTTFILRSITGSGSRSADNSDLKEYFSSIDEYEYRRLEMFEKSAVESIMSRENMNDKVVDTHGRVITKLHLVQDRLHAKIDGLESRVSEAMEKIIFGSASVWQESERGLSNDNKVSLLTY